MRAPAFWWRPPGLAAALLAPASLAYGAVAAARMRRPGRRAAVPVICVGNVTVGGAGKTPAAIAVAAILRALGLRPAFLLRGYGGSLAGPVAVDPARHHHGQVGDEALLLARHAPAVVARDRPAGAALAVRLGADVIVMDDGMQNPSLDKDLTLAVFDGSRGIGNGRVLPAGPLRAPMAAQWPAIDACLIVGEGEFMSGFAGEISGEFARDARRIRDVPVLTSRLAPEFAPHQLAGRRVLAVAGIGHPAKFAATLRECGAEVAGLAAFPDHHPFTPAEVRRVLGRAAELGAVPVTTEKDLVRLAALRGAVPEVERIVALPVSLRVDDPGALETLLRHALAVRGTAGS